MPDVQERSVEERQADVAKTVAETDKTLIETALIRRDLELKDAEIQEKQAAARKTSAEARAAGALAEVAVIEAAGAKRSEARELAKDRHHHIFPFTDAVSDASVKRCIEQLTEWSRLQPGCPFEIVFNSPGGSVIHGMALFDFISHIRSKGHHVTTVALGYAASMAGILLQAGDTRVIGRESWLMIHEASFGAQGKIGEVEDTTEWVKRVCGRILDIFADRANGKISRQRIASKWRRKDWWLSSDEALKLGFVDEVR